MFQDPVERLAVDNGSASQCPSPPSKSSPVKDIFTTATVCVLMFTSFLFAGDASISRLNALSRDNLLREIDSLQQDLESFEKLKQQYDHDETQLNWDKQQIIESEDIVTNMLNESQELSERFNDEEREIRQESEHMHQDLLAAAKSNREAATRDQESISYLRKDLQDAYIEVKQEHEDTVQLRRQIAEMMIELRRKNIAIPEHIQMLLESLEDVRF